MASAPARTTPRSSLAVLSPIRSASNSPREHAQPSGSSPRRALLPHRDAPALLIHGGSSVRRFSLAPSSEFFPALISIPSGSSSCARLDLPSARCAPVSVGVSSTAARQVFFCRCAPVSHGRGALTPALLRCARAPCFLLAGHQKASCAQGVLVSTSFPAHSFFSAPCAHTPPAELPVRPACAQL
jgi:hypothetical protein